MQWPFGEWIGSMLYLSRHFKNFFGRYTSLSAQDGMAGATGKLIACRHLAKEIARP
jgi:hypothetical protein